MGDRDRRGNPIRVTAAPHDDPDIQPLPSAAVNYITIVARPAHFSG
ncbi:MAG: hypothetical protein JW765_01945 [Deltaproteobacteria bacterium]|nr:hypothetical protein [Candidatus Zymogenaceae bacterium]